MGFETDPGSNSGGAVAPGLGLAADPGLEIYRAILDSYECDHFIRSGGIYDQSTVVVRVTDILKERGLKDVPGMQEVAGITIYPSEFFCPKDFLTGNLNITNNTCSIHHYDGTWAGPFTRIKHRIMRRIGPRGVARYKTLKSKLRDGA